MRYLGILAAAGLSLGATSVMAGVDVSWSNPLQKTNQFTIGVPAKGNSLRFDGSTYSNITNFTGFAINNGGAVSISSANGTKFLADDLNMTGGGGTLDEFTFSVANSNTVTVTARPRVRFYATDGAGGQPGTFLAGYSFNPIAFAPGVATFTTGPGLANPTIFPQNIWAAIFFDGSTAAPAPTTAQLNKLGVGTFDAPTIGTSADQDWLSSLTGGANSLVNNPVGATRTSPFAGAPVANYGWEFSFLGATPAPGAAGLLGLGGLFAGRRRRA